MGCTSSKPSAVDHSSLAKKDHRQTSSSSAGANGKTLVISQPKEGSPPDAVAVRSKHRSKSRRNTMHDDDCSEDEAGVAPPPPHPPPPLVFRPDPPCQDDANEHRSQGDESEEEEGCDDDGENATQHDESQDDSNSSICSSDDDHHYPDEGYTSSYTTATTSTSSSSYPSPKEVIYDNGSFDDTEDRICNMLNSMSDIHTALAIKGEKVARERRMEKMRKQSSDGGNDKDGGGI